MVEWDDKKAFVDFFYCEIYIKEEVFVVLKCA